jgi:hypothetical protein
MAVTRSTATAACAILVRMRSARAFVFSLAMLAGCNTNWTFDGNAPSLPLVGTPPEIATLQKFNDGPVYSSYICYGADGAYWLALQEQSSKLNLQRLSAPAASAELDGDQFTITWRNFFVWKNGAMPASASDPQPATLTIVSAAQAMSSAQMITYPNGIGGLSIGGADDVFAYVPPKDFGTTYELRRVAQSSARQIPFPGGDAGRALTGSFFSGDGSWFFDRTPCTSGCDTTTADLDLSGTERSTITAHAVDAATDVTVGSLPRRILVEQPAETMYQFFTCGSDGVKVIPFSPSGALAATLLDATPCASDLFTVAQVTINNVSVQRLFYMINGQLRYVPLDGSAPAKGALDESVNRVLEIDDLDFIIYSQTDENKYIYGVGDGWINGWKFMNRGRSIDLASDHSKIHFLENAAQDGGVGELYVAPLYGTPVPLQLNVYQYDELADGRILAAANHAYTGTQNRIVVIDETKGQAEWVVDQASQYDFIPGSNDLMVDIVTGASSYDLVRVPIPPKE